MRRWILSLVCLAVSAPAFSQSSIDVEKNLLLRELAVAADHYRSMSLSFTADETIRVLRYPNNSKRPREYLSPVNVYFYQKTAEGRLNDRRIKRSDKRSLEKQLARSQDVSKLVADFADPMSNAWIPYYVRRPYGWILLFGSKAQDRYSYSVEELLTHDARPAVRISFEPRSDAPLKDDWFGTAIVDLDTFGLLFAEGLQLEDHRMQQRIESLMASPEELPASAQDRTYVVKRVSTEFGLEKAGLRFPTKVRTRVQRYVLKGPAASRQLRSRPAIEIIQRFKEYKIFEVHTEETVRALGTPS